MRSILFRGTSLKLGNLVLILTGNVLLTAAIRNMTAITIHTDPKSWHDAKLICEANGGQLLELTNYPDYRVMRDLPRTNPWNTVPVVGMGAWINLHKESTPDGQDIFSGGCEALSDFQVIDWGPTNQPSAWDGQGDCMTFMVTSSYVADYTLAPCSNMLPFFCQRHEGPCRYDYIANKYYGGVTNRGKGFMDLEACKRICDEEKYEYFLSGMLVAETCWSFTLNNGYCSINLGYSLDGVLNSMYNDFSGGLYIRQCFKGEVNNDIVTLEHENLDPSSPSLCWSQDSSTMTPVHVMWFPGTWTWNEAFQTCQMSGGTMLNDIDLLTQQGLKQFSEIKSSTTWWLGLHRPDPQHNMNVQLWSDCEIAQDVKISGPNIGFTDTRLCAVVNTSDMEIQYAKCNEQHGLVCLSNGTESTGEQNMWNYTNGEVNSIGSGIASGPFSIDLQQCMEYCNTFQHSRQECWGFAHRNDINECLLYYSTNPMLASENVMSTQDPYVFFRKLVFNYTVMTVMIDDDDSIFPYACCNVPSQCPINVIPIKEPNIPTTSAVEFVLYKSAVSWAVADETCRSNGGALLQVDGVSKYYAIRSYIDRWIEDGSLISSAWTGLVVDNPIIGCSVRWSNSCSAPTWLPTTLNYSSADGRCFAVDPSGFMNPEPCNSSFPFICEVSNGICQTTEVIDTFCPVTVTNDQYAVSTCDDICSLATKDGLECWATLRSAENCTVLYSVDPMECESNAMSNQDFVVTYKSCYTGSTVYDTITDDPSAVVVLNCTYAYSPDPTRCGELTFTTTSHTTPGSSQQTTTSTTTSSTTTSTTSSSTTTTALNTYSTVSSLSTFPSTLSSSSVPAVNDVNVLSIYLTACHCNPNSDSLVLDIFQWSRWYIEGNALDRTQTSKYNRTKLSVYDQRPSAMSIGLVATCFLCFVVAVIACADVHAVLTTIKQWAVRN